VEIWGFYNIEIIFHIILLIIIKEYTIFIQKKYIIIKNVVHTCGSLQNCLSQFKIYIFTYDYNIYKYKQKTRTRIYMQTDVIYYYKILNKSLY